MAHDKVYGVCENKCFVEVAPKTETDAMKEKLDGISLNSSGDIVGDVVGNVTGNVTGNVDGAVYVNVTTTSNSSIGSYEVVPSATKLSPYISTNFSQVTLQTETITINSVTKTKKKGFEFDDTVKIKINLSVTCPDVGVQSCALYRNGTLLTSTNDTTLEIEPVVGDTFYATAKSKYSSRYNSALTINLTLSDLSANWYLA